jgi:hypothetical protein
MKEAELLFEFITKRSNEEVSDHSSEKNLQLHEKLLGFEDKKGSTLLHYAAAGGSELLYNELIKAGCNPNTKNKEGESPLMSARSSGNKRLVEKLKKLGDYSQDTDENQQNVLHSVAKSKGNNINPRVSPFEELVGQGEDRDREDRTGRRPHEVATHLIQQIWVLDQLHFLTCTYNYISSFNLILLSCCVRIERKKCKGGTKPNTKSRSG